MPPKYSEATCVFTGETVCSTPFYAHVARRPTYEKKKNKFQVRTRTQKKARARAYLRQCVDEAHCITTLNLNQSRIGRSGRLDGHFNESGWKIFFFVRAAAEKKNKNKTTNAFVARERASGRAGVQSVNGQTMSKKKSQSEEEKTNHESTEKR